MEFRLENRGAFALVGLPLHITMGGAAGKPEDPLAISRFWQRTMENGSFKSFLAAMPPSTALGVVGACVPDPESARGDFTYLIAIEAPEDRRSLPAACIEVAVPATTWAIFTCRGPVPGAIQTMWPRIMGEWLPGSGYVRAEAPDLEVYPEEDMSRPDSRSEIWLPVRRA
jgi:AraC family transcriptional regulator